MFTDLNTRVSRFALVFCAWALAAGMATNVRAQDLITQENIIRLKYDKSEVMIPMRDGVKLHTTIFTPRDKSQKYPILMKRTPYSCAPYGANEFPGTLGPSDLFIEAGYIFVNQDVRGRFMSEGEFVQVTPHIPKKESNSQVDESSDTFDTIEWMLKNIDNHNSRVGMYGISYPGFYCSAGMIDAHPALKAVSPQAPVGDWYFDDFLHNGAFFLAHAYRWLSNNDHTRTGPSTKGATPQPLPSLDGYQAFLDAGTITEINKRFLKGKVPFWDEMMAHPNRDDFWKKREILPHLKNVAPAVMVVTGWFDAEDLYGSFKTYQVVERLNPNVNNVLVVGPWKHGGWAREDGDRLGEAKFGSKTAAFYRSQIELPFFEKYLKDAAHNAPAEATVFETGTNRWRVFDNWPPKNARSTKMFFQSGGKLSREPSKATANSSEAYDEYISDPAKPVPYTPVITPRMTVEYMAEDQRFSARRPDVLVYQTEVLEKNMVLAGPLEVEMWVTTTGTDADFVVKLIDQFPDGTDPNAQPCNQMMVRSEVFRARFRESFEEPKPLVPGQPTKIKFELLDVMHNFQPGHRLMIHVQSSWFPLVDRNPQKFVPNIYLAAPEDFQKATHRLLRSADFPSSITASVLE